MSEFGDWMRRNRKRLIFLGVIGFVLAAILIWLTNTLWRPFLEDVEDVLVLAPEEADFVLVSEDFPALIRGLEDRQFVRHVERNRNLQSWLDSPKIARTGLMPGLRSAYDKLREVESVLPFDLKVLGDLSGKEVLIAGYEPVDENAEPGFLAVLQPESGLAQIGINALLDPTICDLFVKGELETQLQDLRIEHFNWGARLDFTVDGKVERQVGIARIERAIVVGTEIDAIVKLVRRFTGVYLPKRTDLVRYKPGWVWEGREGSSVDLLVRRKSFDQRVSLVDDWLAGMWGSDLTNVFLGALPVFAGKDLYLQLDIDEAAVTKGAIGVSQREEIDLFSRMVPLRDTELDAQDEALVQRLPHYVFGYGVAGAEPAALASFALRRPALVDKDQRELLYELLAELPRFERFRRGPDDTPDLTSPLINELEVIFGDHVGVILFKKEREQQVEHGAPGVAIALRVRDELGLRSLINEFAEVGKQPFQHYEGGDFEFWHIVKDAFLDDRENNKPAFALIGDYLVVTNWVRLFLDMQEVAARRQPSLRSRDLLTFHRRVLPEGSRAFLFLDPDRLYDHMDQAKMGWIAERSTVNAFEKLAIRKRVQARWHANPQPGVDSEAWIEAQYQQELRKLESERSRARIEAEIDRNLDYFRDSFSDFFLSLGIGPENGELQFELRLATKENY